ncbi:MAG: GspH/FimT family pseudopilin [Gammaproteobacteria bacterium]|nr:GspH/FimT family pseudopilin [Gammaproteobacteria bacterium]
MNTDIHAHRNHPACQAQHKKRANPRSRCVSFSTNCLAYSLIELLLSLLIVAVLASFAAPSFKDFIDSARVDAQQEMLRKAIYRTRSSAIYSKKIVSLCPYGESGCGALWEQGMMIFTDANNNGEIDPEDTLLERIYFKPGSYRISWRASARKNYLRYSPTGMARAFGRFTICDKSDDLRLARTIVVNRQGRTRTYSDRNGDGIVEDIDGRLPQC